MKKRLACWAAGVTMIGVALTGVALATPGAGVVGTIMARGGFADPTSVMFQVTDDQSNGKRIIQVRNAQDTVIQEIVFSPDGHTGWHSHPGPALALVKQGELTLYSADDPTCTGRTYSAGQAFIDPGQGHVHIGRASPLQDTIVWVTYFDVPPGTGVRLDAADPGTCIF
jgi:quercetin dioxygenase-like cupin family protein